MVTFDQPLYWKAQEIVANVSPQLDSVVLILGCFHTHMSFLGAIGYIMGGSGIQESLTKIYAPNSVDSILSGKAYGRAVRAHVLVTTALHGLLLSGHPRWHKQMHQRVRAMRHR